MGVIIYTHRLYTYIRLCTYYTYNVINNNIIHISQHGYVNRCGGAYLDGVCGLRDETRENEKESRNVEITANIYIKSPTVEITENNRQKTVGKHLYIHSTTTTAQIGRNIRWEFSYIQYLLQPPMTLR